MTWHADLFCLAIFYQVYHANLLFRISMTDFTWDVAFKLHLSHVNNWHRCQVFLFSFFFKFLKCFCHSLVMQNWILSKKLWFDLFSSPWKPWFYWHYCSPAAITYIWIHKQLLNRANKWSLTPRYHFHFCSKLCLYLQVGMSGGIIWLNGKCMSWSPYLNQGQVRRNGAGS